MRTILVLILLIAPAHAQPADPVPVPVPDPVPVPVPVPVPDPAPPPPAEPAPDPYAAPDPAPDPVPVPQPALDPPDPAPPPPPPEPPPPPIALPEILAAPSARLLPAAMIYSRSSLDTSGGFGSDLRVGLGDVAEFGVATTDLVRRRLTADADPERIWPYLTATFKMGVAEDRTFAGQPALALGFRKSFERSHEGHRSRIAELHLVASRRLGSLVTIHAGGVFWDASLRRDGGAEQTLHDRGVARQLRPFGGLEVRPLEDAQILVDLYWVPELCYGCGDKNLHLEAILSWGVRYDVNDRIKLDSGVRVQDIRDANLLDAQIFGQVTFLSGALRRLVGR